MKRREPSRARSRVKVTSTLKFVILVSTKAMNHDAFNIGRIESMGSGQWRGFSGSKYYFFFYVLVIHNTQIVRANCKLQTVILQQMAPRKLACNSIVVKLLVIRGYNSFSHSRFVLFRNPQVWMAPTKIKQILANVACTLFTLTGARYTKNFVK